MDKVIFFCILVLMSGWLFYGKQEGKISNFSLNHKVEMSEVPIFLKNNLTSNVASVHSATIAPLKNGDLLAMWFGGSGEGKSDVEIYGSVYHAQDNTWSDPKSYLTRERLKQESSQFIKKLGNPVLYRAKNGNLHFFVTGVSLGGWATSKIYHFISKDEGKNFTYKQLLQLSPFANLSFLVRTQPVGLEDGGFYLPVYHELARKYPVVVRFDAEGKMLYSQKMTSESGLLQPSIAPISPKECLAVFRNYDSGLMKMQKCKNAGMLWETPKTSNVTNEGNTANIINFDGNLYLIHNTRENNPAESRGTLVLSKLVNQEWKQIAILDVAQGKRENGKSVEVSYPTTIVNGEFVDIVYTYNRVHISHIRFNKKWILQQEAM